MYQIVLLELSNLTNVSDVLKTKNSQKQRCLAINSFKFNVPSLFSLKTSENIPFF